MRTFRRAVLLGLSLASTVAVADPNDFHVAVFGNPNPGGTGYRANSNNLFRAFVNEIGAGITSANLMPPSSLGHDGFSFTAELSVVSFDTNNPNFKVPAEGNFTNPLLIPSAHIRKGLPFSFELGARLGWIDKSRMGTATIELKWAVNEGFAYLPDIGVRGYGTRLINNRDFDLTAAGFDIGVGKRFAIGGMVTLTPYGGWNLVFVGASSNNVDFNPNSAQIDVGKDMWVFDQVGIGANSHSRFYGGLRFIGGVFQLGAEISYSLLGSFKDTAGADIAMPNVLAINSTLGLDF